MHVWRRLKARAASSERSRSEYLRAELLRTASRPTPEELAARIRARGAVELPGGSEAAVRHLREHGE